VHQTTTTAGRHDQQDEGKNSDDDILHTLKPDVREKRRKIKAIVSLFANESKSL
jgi:hypothetical protein